MVDCEMRDTSTSRKNTDARCDASPNGRAATLMACNTGLTKSTCPGSTTASTALVPKINNAAMMGAEIMTDLAMIFSGSRHSPANTATYSNPPKAKNANFPKILRFNNVNGGIASDNVWR